MSQKLPPGIFPVKGGFEIDKCYKPEKNCETVRLRKVDKSTAKVAIAELDSMMRAEYNIQVNGHQGEGKKKKGATWAQGVQAYWEEKGITPESDEFTYFRVLNRYIPKDMLLNDICNATFQKLRQDSKEFGLYVPRENEKRKLRKNKKAATNRYIQVARAVIRFCRSEGTSQNPWVDADPVLRLADEDEEKRIAWVLTNDESIRLLDALPDYVADIALFILHTSVRSGEAVNLKWRQLHTMPEIGRFFLIPTSEHKNKEAKPVYLNAVAEEIIRRCRGKNSEYVFTYEGQGLAQFPRKSWKAAMKRANLWDTSPEAFAHSISKEAHYPIPHDLRKTCNTRMKHLGIPLGTRKMILGHKSGHINDDVYTVATLEPFKQALDQLVDKREQVQNLTLLRQVK